MIFTNSSNGILGKEKIIFQGKFHFLKDSIVDLDDLGRNGSDAVARMFDNIKNDCFPPNLPTW